MSLALATAICVEALSANIFVTFFRCERHVCPFETEVGSHLHAKSDGSVTANAMLCHVLMHVLSSFYKTYQFRGIEALGLQMIEKR